VVLESLSCVQWQAEPCDSCCMETPARADNTDALAQPSNSDNTRRNGYTWGLSVSPPPPIVQSSPFPARESIDQIPHSAHVADALFGRSSVPSLPTRSKTKPGTLMPAHGVSVGTVVFKSVPMAGLEVRHSFEVSVSLLMLTLVKDRGLETY